MPKLTGQDIAELGTLLADTLSFEDLEMYVHASTGDKLYVAYVGKGLPLKPTVVALLNAL